MRRRLLGLPARRDERVTHDDILAMTQAGTDAGVLHQQEQQVIENAKVLARTLAERGLRIAQVPRLSAGGLAGKDVTG